jgi:DNA adenine methylase
MAQLLQFRDGPAGGIGFAGPDSRAFTAQLLKWVGNKQRHAPAIISRFPRSYRRYLEPFLGAGGVLGVLAPDRAIASDIYAPLMEIWQCLRASPDVLKEWYRERWELGQTLGRSKAYTHILARFNSRPNGADLLYLSRSCYGGVVRFRKADGGMSTPVGAHSPIMPCAFAQRVDAWRGRVWGVEFVNCDYRETIERAGVGDLIYCDPPYQDSQAILYGAQAFELRDLFAAIESAKRRGAYVALSIDGRKRSGKHHVEIEPPRGLFEREEYIGIGRSMLKRFQMEGQTLVDHEVSDRLLLSWS